MASIEASTKHATTPARPVGDGAGVSALRVDAGVGSPAVRAGGAAAGGGSASTPTPPRADDSLSSPSLTGDVSVDAGGGDEAHAARLARMADACRTLLEVRARRAPARRAARARLRRVCRSRPPRAAR